MTRKEKIKMADSKVASGSTELISEGVGSCVIVCLIDNENEIGGMAHVVLPSKTGKNSSKYADTILQELLNKMNNAGADKSEIEAKIFGGAQLFEFSSDIGDKNVESVMNFLKKEDIPVVGRETGGDKGRTVHLNSKNGRVKVEKAKGSEKLY